MAQQESLQQTEQMLRVALSRDERQEAAELTDSRSVLQQLLDGEMRRSGAVSVLQPCRRGMLERVGLFRRREL